MPFVSIIIPTKNEAKNLPVLLKMIAGQAFTDYEVIVADAQSLDETRQIAESFGARVVEGGLPGPGRNRGAAVAQGKVLLFLDADVQFPSTKFLKDEIAEMERKHFDVGGCLVTPLSRRPVDVALHQAYNAYVLATEKIRPHAVGACIFVRRDVHEALHGFDESVVFAEDMDYAVRAQRHGFRFGILRSHPIAISVRRLDKDGRLAIALKFIFAEFRMISKGSFTEAPFEYEMGGDIEKIEDRNSSSS